MDCSSDAKSSSDAKQGRVAGYMFIAAGLICLITLTVGATADGFEAWDLVSAGSFLLLIGFGAYNVLQRLPEQEDGSSTLTPSDEV